MIPMFVPNLTTNHREWHGPNFVEIYSGDYYQVIIEGIGDERFFCLVDKTKPEHAYVIPDREVWVRYDDGKTRAMIPAFLLCESSTDEWVTMLGESRVWEELLLDEDTDGEDEAKTTATGYSA